MPRLDEFKQSIQNIKTAITNAETEALRPPGSVRLLAVSKGQPVEAIRQACLLGLKDFGENYLQEALEKMEQIQEAEICWHYIGSIQSRKAKTIARHFNWVHSVSRLNIAEILNEFRPLDMPPLNVCIQVNLSGEASKSGLNEEELAAVLEAFPDFPRLRCRGLMTMPPADASDEEKFILYQRLYQLLTDMNQKYCLKMDSLSMGMSNDFQLAIAAGSTIVRVGQALFGPRAPIK